MIGKTVPCVLLVAALLAADALAGPGIGPRLGMTLDPDQAHGGFHLSFGEFFPGWSFQPNLEIGAGGGVTVVAVNFETLHRFRDIARDVRPYVGLGLGVNFTQGHDHQGPMHYDDWHMRGDEDLDLGFNVMLGLEKRVPGDDVFFGELKLGLAGGPDAKITFGWTFQPPFQK